LLKAGGLYAEFYEIQFRGDKDEPVSSPRESTPGALP